MIVFVILLTLLMCVAIYTDVTRFVIPNQLNGLILLLYPVMYLTTPEAVALKPALFAFAGVTVVGLLLFYANVTGGGDVKMLMALAPWLSNKAMLPFFIYMALLGGVLAILLLTGRPLVRFLYRKMNKPETALPMLITNKKYTPYGVAIAGAFLIVLYRGMIAGLTEF